MRNYLGLWAEGLLERKSVLLAAPVSVLGEREKRFSPKSEFAKVQLSVHPAESFDVRDVVAERNELERLGVRWPESVIFGLLDVLMLAEFGPLYKVLVVLEKSWYHEVDSSENAFRNAGRDAGLKIIETMKQQRLVRFERIG